MFTVSSTLTTSDPQGPREAKATEVSEEKPAARLNNEKKQRQVNKKNQKKPPSSPPPADIHVPPPVERARRGRAQWLLILSFLFFVVGPSAVTAWYLWTRAVDQYASYVGFSVRSEEVRSAVELLGGITELSGSSSSDTDILFSFLQSQELVKDIDAELDLREKWSKADAKVDPVFAYHAPGTIEDLVDHWERKVKVYYDSGSGLLDVVVLAFDPNDAQEIAKSIFAASSEMINELSAIAQEDAIQYAREELQVSVNRLKEARQAITEFRNRTQIVDPSIDTQGQMGLLSNLQAQLATALIELDELKETTRESDPRVTVAERKVRIIETRIAEERQKLGIGSAEEGEDVFANLVGEYERLFVDREFAEQTYVGSLANFDAARNEARRKSRYLAAHVRPTLAEKAEYPQRLYLWGLITLFLFLIWTVGSLVAFSLRDRR